jgi:hypothetical protein
LIGGRQPMSPWARWLPAIVDESNGESSLLWFSQEEADNVGLTTLLKTVFRSIRLKSAAPTFSGTDFVCQKTCLNRSFDGAFSDKYDHGVLDRGRG